MQIPGPLVPGGPKGRQEQTSAALHASSVALTAQESPLEQVSAGMGTGTRGMQKPAVALKMEPHHWQHLAASHSGAVVMLHVSLGFGGMGASGSRTATLRSTLLSFLTLNSCSGIEGGTGARHLVQL